MLLLPKDLREAIDSFDWIAKCDEIGKRYKSLEDEISALQGEVLIALMGLESIDDFTDGLEYALVIDKATAQSIAADCIKEILTPIAQKRVEIIKNNAKNNPPSWDQWMQFVMTNGNYSFLADKPTAQTFIESKTPKPVMDFIVKKT